MAHEIISHTESASPLYRETVTAKDHVPIEDLQGKRRGSSVESVQLKEFCRNCAIDQRHYTQNGTIDSKGKPADKRRTGKWAGCFPMLGKTLETLLHSLLGIYLMYFRVTATEVAATVIFFAISSNLVTYMTNVLHQGVAKSARDVNNWVGTLFVSSVLGAFLSDTYWGRYRTMSYAFLLYCLTISASVKNLTPPTCPAENYTCAQATAAQSGFVYFSLYAIAFAAGSMTASLMAFGADQFDETDDSERQQKYSFLNWLLWCISLGGLISVTGLIYVEDHVGWGWGFGILLIVLSIALALFLMQTRRYRYRKPAGSPLTKIAQVLVAAFKKHNVVAPADVDKLHEEHTLAEGERLIPHTNQFLFLDKAAVKLENPEVGSKGIITEDQWNLCTVTRVEEVKLVIRMLPIWFATLWFSTAPSQSVTWFVRQGMNMDNRLGSFKVPPASMLLFSNSAVLIFMPIYDNVLVPVMRKFTKNERGITLLQRIGIGIFISIVALVIAALLEIKRKHASEQLSIFWLLPPYILLGIAEGMANTGVLEFFNEQAPDTMHSLGVSFGLANFGVGSFLSAALITCVNKAAPVWLQNDINKGHVDYFYWLLAGLSIVNLMVYAPLAWWYTYKTVNMSSFDSRFSMRHKEVNNCLA